MARIDLNALLAEQRRLNEQWAKHNTQMNRMVLRQIVREPMSLYCACGGVAPLDEDVCPTCQASLDEATPVTDRFLRTRGFAP